MNRKLIFQQIYFDTQHFKGSRSIDFFNEADDHSSSITTMTEEEAIQWLFGFSQFSSMFKEEFFETPQRVRSFYGLTAPFTAIGRKPGDIDLLLVDDTSPNKAIAFECKRVKLTSTDKNTSKVNNAGAIKTGIKQVNGLQSIGFYKSYLMVILLDDSRLREYPNAMMRNSKGQSVEEIYDIPQNEPLHEDVGIVFVKVTQPTGKHFNDMAGIGFCVDKKAKELEQSSSLTNKVNALLRDKD